VACQKTLPPTELQIAATITTLTSTVFYLVPVHPVITALFNFHGTQLFSACSAILLSIELAPFLEDEPIPIPKVQ